MYSKKKDGLCTIISAVLRIFIFPTRTRLAVGISVYIPSPLR